MLVMFYMNMKVEFISRPYLNPMNLNFMDIAEQYPELNITVKASDLIKAIDYCVSRTKQELELQITDAKAETYPSPKRVSEILDVDLSTLWRWNKRGYLCHTEVGGKRRYKMSDVNAILKGGK